MGPGKTNIGLKFIHTFNGDNDNDISGNNCGKDDERFGNKYCTH